MSGIEQFFARIPDERLLICGEAGEYWTDRARFSSAKPQLLPPVYNLEELKASLNKASDGNFLGLYLAWGLSKLLEERETAERLFSLLEGGASLLAVELLESDHLPPAQVNHTNYLKLLYQRDPLPRNRILSLLKSFGFTQLRLQEYFSYDGLLRVRDFSAIYGFAAADLKARKDAQAEKLLQDIEAGGFEPAPFLLISGSRRKDLSGAGKTVSRQTLVKAEELSQNDSLKRKAFEFGLDKLDDSEVISLALDCDAETAGKILRNFGGKALLKDRELDKLSSLLGIDDDRTLRLLALLEAGRRFYGMESPGIKLISPEAAAQYLSDMRDLKREHLRGLYLDIRGNLVYDEIIAIGRLNRALAEPREIIAPGIAHNAVGLIIAHNHPSAPANPSLDDEEMTALLENAANLMNIDLWDHIIIAKDGYYSFNQAGKIKKKRYG